MIYLVSKDLTHSTYSVPEVYTPGIQAECVEYTNLLMPVLTKRANH